MKRRWTNQLMSSAIVIVVTFIIIWKDLVFCMWKEYLLNINLKCVSIRMDLAMIHNIYRGLVSCYTIAGHYELSYLLQFILFPFIRVRNRRYKIRFSSRMLVTHVFSCRDEWKKKVVIRNYDYKRWDLCFFSLAVRRMLWSWMNFR